MARRIETHTIAGPAGKLEALLEEPEQAPAKEVVVVCHPHPLYGGTMHNKVVYRLARGLRRSGSAVLRFNFRGVGRSEGKHTGGAGEIADAEAALAWLRARFPALPFSLAGFSFGSRVILKLGCGHTGASRLIAAGYPTDGGSSAYLSTCSVHKIFIQSTHDEYGPKRELEGFFQGIAEPKRLIWIEAEDHFFRGALENLEEAVRGL